MMQPVDIKSQSFGKGLFGYKKNDIDQYVDTVYRAYDELFTENKKLREENDRLNKVLEENRLKLFELENKGSSSDDAEARKSKIISDAEKAAADIIAKARQESEQIARQSKKNTDSVKVETNKDTFRTEPIAEDKKKEESATSKFFKKSEDDSAVPNDILSAADGDDDVFVGEIEDNRKPNKVMIGDGEDDGSDDFEFL